MVSPRLIRYAATVALVALLGGCGRVGAPPQHLVRYEVAGFGQADITYVTSNMSLTTENDALLPWRRDVRVPAGAYVSLLVAGPADAPLMCTLSVDGRQAGRQVSGDISVVKCDATVR